MGVAGPLNQRLYVPIFDVPGSKQHELILDPCRDVISHAAIEALSADVRNGWKADIAELTLAALRKGMSEFASHWAKFHPKGPPVAHLLREAERETWVRFHSLPLSKRYATSKREKWTVLDRANKLASRVLGENARCWLVQAEPDHGDAANDADAYGTISEYQLNFEFEHPSLEDDCAYRIFVAQVTWSAGAFNDLISKRADHELPLPTMWVSVESGAAFAPYDGGSDLFLQTADDVAKLKREFAAWLSDDPDGL